MNPQVGRCPVCSWRAEERELQEEWRDRAKDKHHPAVGATGDGREV